MRIVGLLSWFDEDPAFLKRAIASHADAGLLDAVVAVDGRYALYGRGGPATSTPDEYATIAHACHERGLDLALVSRETPWDGEVHKRRALFQHGLAMAEVGRDWFWVIDGDNELIEHPEADEVRARLASTPLHACELILSEPGKKWQDVRRPMRQLFRALPGFSPYGRHWHYVAQVDGEWAYLWGPKERALVPALELHEIVVRHHHMDREQERRNRAYSYYAERDSRQVEQSPGWIVAGEDGYPVRADAEQEVA